MYNHQWYLDHKEEVVARATAWKKSNPDRLRAQRSRHRARPGSRQKDKKRLLKFLYGISIEKYEEMLIESCGKCAVCLKQFKNCQHEPMLDHNHTTGEVRGLLCSRCNSAIGFMEDSADLLEAAVNYLRRQ